MNDHKTEMEEQLRLKIFERDLYRCQCPGCTSSASEFSYRITRTEINTLMVIKIIKELYKRVYNETAARAHFIYAPENILASCQKHKDYFNCVNNPEKVRDILKSIMTRIKQDENRMCNTYRRKRQRVRFAHRPDDGGE
jgi:hypothetical protein